MGLRFIIVVKRGPKEVARIVSEHVVGTDKLTVEDVTSHVIQTEQFLERLTGYRWHIESETTDQPPTIPWTPGMIENATFDYPGWSKEKADRLTAESKAKEGKK